MIEIKKLTDNELIRSADEAVAVEKEAVRNTTRHFQEILARRSFLPEYTNMFELLTKRWGYCNGSAQLRIGALHLIRQVPAVQAKIESGEISMTVAASIQTFLNREKILKRPYSQNAKIELVDACTGMSRLEAQKEFVRRNPELEKHESFRFTSPDRVRLNVSISAKTYEQMSELRDILSHTEEANSIGELIGRLVQDAYDRHSPKRKAERSKKRKLRLNIRVDRSPKPAGSKASSADMTAYVSQKNERAASEVEPYLLHPDEVRRRTRYIPMSERSKVPDDGEGCVHTVDGRRCRSKKFLQLDHIIPFAEGGSNTAENLRWMCGAHNRFRSPRAEL